MVRILDLQMEEKKQKSFIKKDQVSYMAQEIKQVLDKEQMITLKEKEEKRMKQKILNEELQKQIQEKNEKIKSFMYNGHNSPLINDKTKKQAFL